MLVLAWRLMQKVDLLPPSLRELQLGRFLKNGNNHSSYLPFLLLMRFVPENNNIEIKSCLKISIRNLQIQINIGSNMVELFLMQVVCYWQEL